MGQKMTEKEARGFMSTGSKTGKLATVRADGRPHVAAVWFSFDESGNAIFLSHQDTIKAANMRRDPRVTLFVDDEEMPFAFARLDGVVISMTTDLDELRHWATETCRRYVGDDRAEEFGARNAVEGETLVRVRPTKLVGYTGVAD